MDLTQYGPSPYAPGGKARNTQAQNPLAAIVRGTLGVEEPGSVLDPNTVQRKAINDATQIASLISDLIPGKATLGAAGAAAGMLRRTSWRKDLFLTHGTMLENLINPNSGKLIAELTHPSMAVTRGSPAAPFGDVQLVARPDVFDPRRYPSVLHNTDAWTPNYRAALAEALKNKAQQVGATPSTADLARARLRDRFETRFPKGGLNALQEKIIGSLRFPSFKAYENSAHPDLLTEHGMWPQDNTPFFNDLESFLGDVYAHVKVPAGKVSDDIVLKNLARGLMSPRGLQDSLDIQKFLQNNARDYIAALRELPQQYAELKAFGHTPITGSSFSHAIFEPNAQLTDDIVDQFMARGIRPYVPGPKHTPEDIAEFVNRTMLNPPRGWNISIE